MVLDTPTGLHGKRLREIFRRAHQVVVPLQPSVFDIFATQDFLNELADSARAAKIDIGIVGMRVDERTRARAAGAGPGPVASHLPLAGSVADRGCRGGHKLRPPPNQL